MSTGDKSEYFTASIAEMDSLIKDIKWVLKTSGKEHKVRPLLNKAIKIRNKKT